MTIRIIKDGRAGRQDPQEERQVTCKQKNCLSVIGYKLDSVGYINASQSEDIWIECPVCRNVINLVLDFHDRNYVRDRHRKKEA